MLAFSIFLVVTCWRRRAARSHCRWACCTFTRPAVAWALSAGAFEYTCQRTPGVQASFHIFGMELLATLDVTKIHEFFDCFFRLPDRYWRGFLASKLSSVDLMAFAMLTFMQCSTGIRAKLVQHLATDVSGGYMLQTYTKEIRDALLNKLEGR